MTHTPYVPSEEDRDPEAEERMQQGRLDISANNALYDPWFVSPQAALSWQPGDGPEGRVES